MIHRGHCSLRTVRKSQTMKKVAPQVYRFSGLTAGNAYLIDDADGLTIIDTSIAPSGAKILKQITALGRQLSEVKRILITHAHPDHIGGLPEVQQATGAQVIASALEKPVIQGEMPIPRGPDDKKTGLARFISMPETTMPGTPVHRVVEDGEILPEVLGGLQVVATPGHAPGHLAWWQPAQRILFCGDTIFRLPNLRLPFSFFTVDMAENKRSIARLAALDADIVCFGHGKPLVENTAQSIRGFSAKVNAH